MGEEVAERGGDLAPGGRGRGAGATGTNFRCRRFRSGEFGCDGGGLRGGDENWLLLLLLGEEELLLP